MKISFLSVPAKELNEDSCYACEKYGFVIDGATPLDKKYITSLKSDASWFAQTIKEYLTTALQDESKPLKTILENAVQFTWNKYTKFLYKDKLVQYPSSTLGVYRVLNNTFEYKSLGNITLLVQYKDGQVEKIIDNSLDFLDEKNIQKMIQIAKEKNISILEANKYIIPDLKATRKLQNKPIGYYILNDSVGAISHTLSKEIDINTIQKFCIMSDGFSELVDLFHYYKTYEDFLNHLTLSNLQEQYDILYGLQEHDALCNQYPRFKLRDDSTIIYGECE